MSPGLVVTDSQDISCQFSIYDTSIPENTLHSPISAGSCIGITAATPLFLLSTRVAVGTHVRTEREGSGLVSKCFLQTKAEAVDPIVKLVPDLVCVAQFERL